MLILSTIKKGELEKMKKVHLGVILAGAAVGLAALILTALGNPTNLLHNYEKDIPRLCATTNYRGKDNEKQGAWQRNANLFQ